MEIIDINASSAIECRIVYLMVHSQECMDELAPRYKRGTFANRYYDMAARMAVGYYNRRKTVLGAQFQRYFNNAVEKHTISAEDAAELRVVIEGWDNQPPVTDVDFEIDEALEFLSIQLYKLASEEATALLADGKFEEAKELLKGLEDYKRAKIGGNDILSYSAEEYDAMLQNIQEQLIQLPGALGKIMNDTLVRNAVVTLYGRGKVGKSWWLILLARIARNQGRNVIFISAGDMTEAQIHKRILQADLKTTADEQYLDKQFMPYFDCIRNQKGLCFEHEGEGHLMDDFQELPSQPIFKADSGYKPCNNFKCPNRQAAVSWCNVRRPLLTGATIMEWKSKRKDTGGILHVEHAPSGTLTIAARRDLVRGICRKYGWTNPDIIVIDYANILAKEHPDKLEATNLTWQSLRADADIFDCLVVTATHSNRTGLRFEDLTLESVAGDSRILNEIAAMFALNQTPDERRKGIWRVAALLKREAEFDETRQAECYGNLAMGTPHIISQIVHRELPEPLNRN